MGIVFNAMKAYPDNREKDEYKEIGVEEHVFSFQCCGFVSRVLCDPVWIWAIWLARSWSLASSRVCFDSGFADLAYPRQIDFAHLL